LYHSFELNISGCKFRPKKKGKTFAAKRVGKPEKSKL